VFLNNANIDRNARKQIRSHVAKGRNVGKKLPSRRKQCKQRVKNASPIRRPRAIEGAQGHGSKEAIPAIEWQIGDGLSVLSFLVELTPGSKGLIQKCITDSNCTVTERIFVDYRVAFTLMNGSLYPPELRNAIDFAGAGSHTIQYIFLDEACTNSSRISLFLFTINTT
jgi:hypothetical protein